jgi:hypothetical protein
MSYVFDANNEKGDNGNKCLLDCAAEFVIDFQLVLYRSMLPLLVGFQWVNLMRCIIPNVDPFHASHSSGPKGVISSHIEL